MENRFLSLILLSVCVVLARIVVLTHLPVSLYVDEAQYWTWSQNLDWGYFSKPPLVAFLIFCSVNIFGDGLIGVKFLAMCLYPCTAWVLFFTAQKLKFSPENAFWAGALMLFLPIFAWLGLVVSTDSLLILFWALSFYCFICVLENNHFKYWIFLGVFLGLGFLTKYSMAVFVFSAFLYLLFFKRDILFSFKPYAALLLSLLIFFPNILWNIENKFPTLKHTAEITIQKKTSGGILPFLEFILSQWLVSGMILGSVFLFLMFNKKYWQNKTFQLLFSFALPFWVVVGFQAFLKEANANWAAPAFLTMILASVLFLENKKKWMLGAFIVEILISILAYSWIFVLPYFTNNLKLIHAPFVRAEGWKELSDSLRPILKENANDMILLAENRTIIAHLSYELRDLNLKILSWNPEKTQKDYYQMQSNLNDFKNKNMLFLSFTPIPTEKLQGYFQNIEKNKGLTVENAENYPKRRLYIQKMEGFRGY